MWISSVRSLTNPGSEVKVKKEHGALQHSWARQRAGGYDCFSVTMLRPAARHFSQKKLMQLEKCVRGL